MVPAQPPHAPRLGVGARYLAPYRCGGNVAHVRQSRPDSGPGFQGQALKPFELFPPNPPKLLDLEWGPDTLLPSEKATTYQV